MAAVRNMGGAGNNSDIYAALENHKKASSNPNWKAKVRQTLQVLSKNGLVVHVAEGQWRAA